MADVDVLRSVPLFSQLGQEDAVRFSREMRRRTYPKNSVIVFEDDPGDAMFIVVSGQVKVVLTGEDGREVILSTLGVGDFFGEMSLIDDEPRSAHVIAMEDSDLFVLRRDDFQRQLDANPRMAIGLLRAVVKRLRQADHQIGSLVLLDVPGRVAKLLLALADEGDGREIVPRLTHHMIAQMVGSSRETVSRTMAALTDQGIVQVGRDSITIQDRERLESAARRS